MSDGRIDAALVRNLYDGEVHYVDSEIGRLIARLREQGMLDETIVVVTADHGESLGEHRYWFEHGRDTYEVTCRIPLVIRLPARTPALSKRPSNGVRSSDLALADLGPTLLALLELPPLVETDANRIDRGTARLASLEDDAHKRHSVFSEKVDRGEKSGAIQLKAVRSGDWKFIRRYAQTFDEGRPEQKKLLVLSEELYDLAQDPGETVNLIDDPPDRAHLPRLQAELLTFSAADVHFADLGLLLRKQRELLERTDPETLRTIEALGY